MTNESRLHRNYGVWYWNYPPIIFEDKVCWGGCNAGWDDDTQCRKCKRPHYTIIRECTNSDCARIFIKDFEHPNYCMVHKKCWLCCEDSNKPCDLPHESWYNKYMTRVTHRVPPSVIPIRYQDIDLDEIIEEFTL